MQPSRLGAFPQWALRDAGENREGQPRLEQVVPQAPRPLHPRQRLIEPWRPLYVLPSRLWLWHTAEVLLKPCVEVCEHPIKVHIDVEKP
eukprot:CAMPEP_0179155270 /NCGR_PEP_ID=MMETSP0796-20121207/75624_1 /TAXON_ID=73915 /ORGANISM="Pyrodinium bahamense, Strain pbaha01" /LENGTH=88 /DNA_ID=CAMNT_0020856737 /DNA_START=120 /DNA_END=383 /DNA_ORIENTATION=-